MIIEGTQITAVEPKPAKNGNQFWVVHLLNGTTASTFNQERANAAREAIGKTVDVNVEQTFKNDRTFTDYLGFKLAANQPDPDVQFATTTPSYRNTEAEKNERIGRMNAATTAFDFVHKLSDYGQETSNEQLIQEAFTLAERIYRFTSGLMPDPTANGVAAEVNKAFGSEAVLVGAETAGSERQW